MSKSQHRQHPTPSSFTFLVFTKNNLPFLYGGGPSPHFFFNIPKIIKHFSKGGARAPRAPLLDPPLQEIVWNFVPVDQTSAISLVVGCKLAPNMEQKYRVESEGGACNLVIDNLSSAHAGTYTCQDFVTGLKPASSELIVLGDFVATLLLRANLHVAEVQVLKRKC